MESVQSAFILSLKKIFRALLSRTPERRCRCQVNLVQDPETLWSVWGCRKSGDRLRCICHVTTEGREVGSEVCRLITSFAEGGQRALSPFPLTAWVAWNTDVVWPMTSDTRWPIRHLYSCVLSCDWSKLVSIHCTRVVKQTLELNDWPQSWRRNTAVKSTVI